MDITGPLRPTTALTLTLPARIVQSWRTGQILNAVVASVHKESGASLRINNQLVRAHTALALTPGQALQLRVVSTGDRPVLNIVDPDSPTQVLAQTWRTALPRQGSLKPLLANLAAFLQANHGPAAKLKPALTQLAERFIRQLPTPAQLGNLEGLKRAVRNSGSFFENTLLHPAPSEPPGHGADIKAQLSRLHSALTAQLAAQPGGGNAENTRLRDTLTGLLEQVEAGLARVRANQVQTLLTQTPEKAAWLIDLPLSHGTRHDVVKLRIQADRPRGPEDEDPSWTVWLDFDLDPLGPVYAAVATQARAVTVNLWAEQATTAELFNTYLTALRTDLDDAGLNVSGLHCHNGNPPHPPRDAILPRLLDEQV